MRRVVVPLCECQGSLLMADADAVAAAERRACLDCGRQTPEGKWRCEDCQRTVAERLERMRATLERARRDESARVHDAN